jgi:hypothetical protein
MTHVQKDKKMPKMKKQKNITHKSFFYKIAKKKPEMEIFAVWVINFEQNKIYNQSAPQNDCLNLSFEKDIHVVSKKVTGKGRK